MTSDSDDTASRDAPNADARAAHLRIKSLFDAVCELPAHPEDGRPFQDSQAGAALRAEGATPEEMHLVEALLRRDREAQARGVVHSGETASAQPDTPVTRMLKSLAEADVALGDTLGPWRIDSVLGGGGMGTVYKATRVDGQFTQVAAIKVLVGMPSPEALAYLARERQILVSLSHPNIARLIDGGTTVRGYPYLAMDYVDGTEIDVWCLKNAYAVRDVVSLFVQVCDTVDYAHQRLTLHCDLKPSNVMVDASGRPVLLDFGIAELIGGARHLGVGGLGMFTPTFASPEQVAGAALGTTSDVYSLGRMLGVLIRAAALRTNTTCPREIDAILKRATEEEAARRYPGVAALAQDLRRWLGDETVSAMPQSVAYTAQKFLRRQWPAVLAASAFVVVVTGLTLSAIAQRDRAVLAEAATQAELKRTQTAEADARRERDRARAEGERARTEGERALAQERIAVTKADEAARASAEARRGLARALAAESGARRDLARAIAAESQAMLESNTTRAVRDFMLGLFEDMNNASPGAKKLTAYELLERGRSKIDSLADQPVVQATLIRTLGKIYDNIGELDAGKTLYRRAVQMERDPRHGRPAELAQALQALALAETNSANHTAAEAPIREALQLRQRLFGAESLEAAYTHGILGLVLSNQRKSAEARPHLEAALTLREKQLPSNHEDIASAAHNLGQYYSQNAEWDQAVLRYRQAIDIKTRIYGAEHTRVYNSVEGLANTLWRANRLMEAEPQLARLYRGQLTINGRQSERFASAADLWANVLYDMGRFQDARVRFEEAIAATAGPPPEKRSFRHTSYVQNFAILLEECGEYDAAESAYRQAIAIRAGLVDADNLALARTRASFSRFLMKRGKLDEAAKVLDEAWQVRQKKLPAGDAELFDTRLILVELAVARQDAVGARAALMALPLPERAPAGRRMAYWRVEAGLAALEGGKGMDVALARLAERAALAEKQSGATHPRAALAQLDHAVLLQAAGKTTESRAIAAAITPVLVAHLAAGSVHLVSLKRIAAARVEK